MKKLRTLVKDSYARALAAALVFTSFAFALTGGALMNAGEAAQVAEAGTIGTYEQIIPSVIILENPGDYSGSSAELIMNSEFRARTVWESGTYAFYSDFDNLFSDQVIKALDRGVAHANSMRMGNFLTFTASDLVINSVEFDPLSQVGATIDIVGDKIFGALTGNNSAAGLVLLSVGVIAVVLVALFQAVRGQGFGLVLRRTGGMLLVLGLFFAMGSAALSRNEEALGLQSNAEYKSTPGTPLWMAQFVNDWLGKVSATVANGFVGLYDNVDTAASFTDTGGVFGCAHYVKAMNENFEEQIELYAPDSSAVSITRVMDQIWYMTGLETWKDAQFGTGNTYGDKVWCHVLNVDTHVPYPTLEANFAQLAEDQGFDWEDYKPAQDPATNNGQAQDSSAGLPGGNTYPTMAFRHPEGAENDVTHMGWAICRAVESDGGWTWELEPGWAKWKGEGSQALDESTIAGACDAWWRFRDDTMPQPDTSNYEKDALDEFETSASHAIEHGAQAADYVAVQDFVGHLSGASAGSAGSAVSGYAFGSIGTFVAYGLVALIVYVAKVFTIVFTIAFWFVALAAMFSSRPFGAVIGKSFSKFVGVSLVATMVTAMLALVVVIASVLMGIGVAIFGAGSLLTMLWCGLSPALALIVLNMIFKKAFHVPSPMSLSGARAWGQAGISGAAGFAAGAGVTAGVGHVMKGMARTTGREMTKGAISRASRGRLGGFRGNNTNNGRRSEMGAEQKLDPRTPTGKESSRATALFDSTRTRDADGRLLTVSNSADRAGRLELRKNRASDETARRAEEVQGLRTMRRELTEGGMGRGEVNATMRTARANMIAAQHTRAEELGLGVRERVRVRAMRAQSRPSETVTSALDSAAHRITQGGGSRGIDSRMTRFANSSLGSRVTRSAHLRDLEAQQRGTVPATPNWHQQTAGMGRNERSSAAAALKSASSDRATAISTAEADRLLDRVGGDGYGDDAGRDAAALRKLQRAQTRADEKQLRAIDSTTKPAGHLSDAGAEAHRRQIEQLERAHERQQRRTTDNNARAELFNERMGQIQDKEGK